MTASANVAVRLHARRGARSFRPAALSRVVLLGLAPSAVRAVLPACYPPLPRGVSFREGDKISAPVTAAEDVEVACAPAGADGCGSDGKKTVERDVTRAYNFECKDAPDVWCNQDVPGQLHGDRAWTQVEECDVSLRFILARFRDESTAPAVASAFVFS